MNENLYMNKKCQFDKKKFQCSHLVVRQSLIACVLIYRFILGTVHILRHQKFWLLPLPPPPRHQSSTLAYPPLHDDVINTIFCIFTDNNWIFKKIYFKKLVIKSIHLLACHYVCTFVFTTIFIKISFGNLSKLFEIYKKFINLWKK